MYYLQADLIACMNNMPSISRLIVEELEPLMTIYTKYVQCIATFCYKSRIISWTVSSIINSHDINAIVVSLSGQHHHV